MSRGGLRLPFAHALILLGMSAYPLLAGTTGQLTGLVVDSSGSPLPGVSVTTASPSQIGGALITATDAAGRFRYPRLAPGEYTVRLQLDGFATQQVAAVQVRLDRTTELRATMPSVEVTDKVQVIEATPVVDPVQVSMVQTFTAEYLIDASAGRENRDLFDLAGQTAGVDGRSGVRVLGSTAFENVFLIDGMDTSYPVNSLNSVSRFSLFEAIDEAAVHTAGFAAEYGLATGGVISVVTKSGGNEFHGSADYRYSDNDMVTSGNHHDPDEEPHEVTDFSASLGGPVLREQLWFFAALQHLRQDRTPSGAPTTQERQGLNYLAKLSWKAAPGWSLGGKILEDPVDARHFESSRFTAPEATWRLRPETRIGQVEVLGQPSDRLLLGFRAGIQEGEISLAPNDGDLITVGHSNLVTGEAYGNALWQEYHETDRRELEADLTWFATSDRTGSHEAKVGLRLSNRGFSILTCYNGHGLCQPGEESFAFFDTADGSGQYRPLVMEVWNGVGWQEFDGTTTSAYLQDTWRLRPDLTLQLGLRWDRSEMSNDIDSVIGDLDLLQPRVGLAWDPWNDGKNIVKLSWGRFMHPSHLAIPAWVAERNGSSTIWLSCSSGVGATDPALCGSLGEAVFGGYRADPETWDPAGWVLIDGSRAEPNTTSTDLKPMYVDELVIGFERELLPRTALEIGYVKKDTHDIIEDTCNGNYPEPSETAACDFLVVGNLPAARRDYEAWLLRFESRALDRIHILSSYVNSRSKGSVESLGVGEALNVYPERFENRYGYLSDHSRHTIKAHGYARLPLDFTIGFGGWWRSEYRWTPIESGLRGDLFLEPRGSRRAGSLHNLDLQVMKGFEVGSTRIRLIATVYNLLDSELPTQVCDSVDGCGDFEMGDATTWQIPRRYEVGFRVAF